MRRLQILLHLLCLAWLGFTLRHAGRNWDEGQLLHPDERFLCMVTAALDAPADRAEWLDTARSPFNPYNRGFDTYVYGTLPLRAVHALARSRDLHEIASAGRLFSTLCDTATLTLVFLFALRLAGPRAASASALLYALCVLPIQQSTFYTVDSPAILLATLCVGLGLLAVRFQHLLLLLASGACVGLAMACRLNMGLLAPWVGLCALALAWNRRSLRPLAALGLGGLLALLLFRLAQPYAFDATGFWPRGLNPAWLSDIRRVHAISDGTLEVPFTLQWVGRPRWIYALTQIAAWGLGWPLAVLCFSGLVAQLWMHRRGPAHWSVLLALWPLLLIAYHGAIHLHTLRYFLPAYPALILGGVLALRLVDPPLLRRLLFGLVAGATALYAAAFLNLHRQPHPRVAASRWLYEHLPAHGVVTAEHWDDDLPLWLPGHEEQRRGLTVLQLPVYDPESPAKLLKMLQAIDRADYLVLSSNRASDSLRRMPLRWPVMSRFYERLLGPRSGDRIGLREVARFERFPSLGGWSLDSSLAEEAFSVYDHPRVRIFEKTAIWQVEVMYELLSEEIDWGQIPVIRYRHAGRWNNGWLSPGEWEARRNSPSATELFPANSAGNNAPLLTWSIVLFLLGPFSLPAAWILFPSLRDRGAAVARLLGLLVIAWLAWLPAAAGLLRFGRALHLAALLWLTLSAALFAWKHDSLLAWLRRRWPRVLLSELVFWLVFTGFLLLRTHQPDLWHPWSGGEKPMDYAYLNATALSAYFPPANPWLSGAFLNYYYYGFVLCSVLMRATGILPSLAYNLLLPTFAALTAGAVFTVATALLPALRSGRARRRAAPIAGLLAVVLTLLSGNLAQLRWLLSGRPGFLNAGYWDASRAIRVPEGEIAPITEFPLFSHLYGDLHAHLMALPIAAFALLLSLQLLRRFHPLRLAASALVLGTLWVTNAWDLPVQAAILAWALLTSRPPPQTPRTWTAHLLRTLLLFLAALLTARLLFIPYHSKMLSPPIAFVPWKGPHSSPFDLLLAHGLFWFPLASIPLLLPLRRTPLRSRLTPLLLVAGCLALTLFVELFALRDDIGRMNTVFKFYYQIWWILACVTAPLLTSLSPLRRPSHALLLFPFFLSLAYPLTAIPAKLRDRHWPTTYKGLDGLAYLADASWGTADEGRISLAPDLRVIRWLRRNAAPLDVLLEAHRPEYQWGGRVSWHTGLPTLLGWNWHMRQQRPHPGADDIVWQRATLVQLFYRTENPDEAYAIARRHRVRFVVFGGLEALTYGPRARLKFERDPRFQPVFRDREAAIYEVHPPLPREDGGGI